MRFERLLASSADLVVASIIMCISRARTTFDHHVISHGLFPKEDGSIKRVRVGLVVDIHILPQHLFSLLSKVRVLPP